MPVVKKTVEHGTDGSGVAQQFSPVLDGAIRGQECAGPFVAPHDDFQQFLGCSQWQFAHAQIVDDQQGHGFQELHSLFPRAVRCRFRKFVEQCVCFAIENAMALLNDGLPDGLR